MKKQGFARLIAITAAVLMTVGGFATAAYAQPDSTPATGDATTAAGSTSAVRTFRPSLTDTDTVDASKTGTAANDAKTADAPATDATAAETSAKALPGVNTRLDGIDFYETALYGKADVKPLERFNLDSDVTVEFNVTDNIAKSFEKAIAETPKATVLTLKWTGTKEDQAEAAENDQLVVTYSDFAKQSDGTFRASKKLDLKKMKEYAATAVSFTYTGFGKQNAAVDSAPALNAAEQGPAFTKFTYAGAADSDVRIGGSTFIANSTDGDHTFAIAAAAKAPGAQIAGYKLSDGLTIDQTDGTIVLNKNVTANKSYELDKIDVTAYDTFGNSTTNTLAELNAALNSSATPTPEGKGVTVPNVYVDVETGKTALRINGKTGTTVANASGTLTITSTDSLFAKRVELLNEQANNENASAADKNLTLITVTKPDPDDPSKTVTVGVCAAATVKVTGAGTTANPYSIACGNTFADNDPQGEYRYALNAVLGETQNGSATFTYDKTAPTVTLQQFKATADQDFTTGTEIHSIKDGGVTLTFAVDGTGSTVNAGAITLSAEDGFYTDASGKKTALDADKLNALKQFDGSKLTLTFVDQGSYDLSKLRISVKDAAGNAQADNPKAVSDYKTAGAAARNYTRIAVIAPSTLKGTYAVQVNGENLKAGDNYLNKAPQSVAVKLQPAAGVNADQFRTSIDAIWPSLAGRTLLTSTRDGDDSAQGVCVIPADNPGFDNGAYTIVCGDPAGDDKPITIDGADGTYTFSAGTDVLVSDMLSDRAANTGDTINLDTKAPTVTFKAYSLADGDDVRNGSIKVLPDTDNASRTLTFDITDAFVGVDAKAVKATGAYTDWSGKEVTFDTAAENSPVAGQLEGDSSNGGHATYTLTLTQPGKYDLSKIKLAVADRAGNAQDGNETDGKTIAAYTPAVTVDGKSEQFTSISILDATELGNIRHQILVDGKPTVGKDVYLKNYKADAKPEVTVLVSTTSENAEAFKALFADLWTNTANVDLLKSVYVGNDSGEGYCQFPADQPKYDDERNGFVITCDTSKSSAAAPKNGAIFPIDPSDDKLIVNGEYKLEANPGNELNVTRLLGTQNGDSDNSFGLDNIGPRYTGATYGADDKTDLESTPNDASTNKVLANDSRTISITAKDLLTTSKDGDAETYTAGMQKVTLEVPFTSFDGKDTKAKAFTINAGDKDKDGNPVVVNGTYVFTLTDDGTYDLNDATVTAYDNARDNADLNAKDYGNTTVKKLGDLRSQFKSNIPAELSISKNAGTTSIQINNAKPDKLYGEDITSVSLVLNDQAFERRWDILKTGYADVNLFGGSTLAYGDRASDDDPTGEITERLKGLTVKQATGEADAGKGGVITWSGEAIKDLLPELSSTNSAQKNGDYTFVNTNTVNGKDDGKQLFAKADKATFKLDTTAPRFTKLTGDTGKEGTTLVTDANGLSIDGKVTKGIYAKADKQTLKVHVQDLLPVEQSKALDVEPQNDDNLRNQGHTAGLDAKTVSIALPAPTDLDGKKIGDAKTISADDITIDERGWFDVPVDQEGFYPLDEITVTISDAAGHQLSRNLTEAERYEPNYDTIVVDQGRTDGRKAAIAFSNAKGNPVSRNANYYYRGGVNQTYTVTDRWFPLYVKLTALHAPFYSGSINTTPQAEATNGNVVEITPSELKRSGDSYTYTVTTPVRTTDEPNADTEGKYQINWQYAGVLGGTHAALDEAAKGGKVFVMDWTAPTTGHLNFSTTKPNQWGWIFSADTLNVTLDGINDPISGICSANATQSDGTKDANDCVGTSDESVRFSKLGFDARISADPAPQTVYSGSSASGVISFAVTGDSQRLTLGNTAIALTDAAGNPVDTGALNKYEDGNVKGVTGVGIDKVAPTVAVAYDNNDVQHEKYYKAKRTATFTLVESNFDFVLANDKDRVIVTSSVDGRKQTLPAEAFKDSGDHKTYTAQITYDQDGDWVVDASFSDPIGRNTALHNEFTIDTIAPTLKLTFDNNDAANGKYYKATRTATIVETERNFSAEQSPVTTTAKDDNGRSVDAPGDSGWRETGHYEHTTTVAFTSENHFTLKGEATDLAGNKAVVVTEPEFVIDLTKPKLTIDNIDDKTAYAGTVSPAINYEDTNLDQTKATYAITGARHGKLDKLEDLAKITTTSEKTTDNTKDVSFTDFERKVASDDVYTIKANVTDMAGNTFEAQKTFSVNRFGSTYTFTSETKDLRGTYLKESKPVTITEINVSGLKPGSRKITVAKDDRATELKSSDYTISTGDDKGWSRTTYTVPANNFYDDGYYRVQVQSTDNAGNLSENTMNDKDADRKATAEVNFAVDRQSPQAAVVGITSGGVYYGGSKQVSVSAKDNLALESAQLVVDGQSVGKWNGEELVKGNPSYAVPADANGHTIVVTTVDKAGNTATTTYDNVIVASNWWQYAMNTPAIRNALIFGTMLLLAAIAIIGVLVHRTRQLSAYRRNPFER